MNNIVFIELGGNMGNKLELIEDAKNILVNNYGCEIIKQSSVYETSPWGFISNSNFYNQIIKIGTILLPEELLNILLNIEKKLGRVRGVNKYNSRTMDMDILFFNNDIFDTKELIVPHPRLHLRRFVLVPMNEIESTYMHPVFKKSIRQLLLSCKDKSECKKVI